MYFQFHGSDTNGAHNSDNTRPIAQHAHLRQSLDPPIQMLAVATFELLREQYWFDAILITDDSIVSDLFSRRLSSLCKRRVTVSSDSVNYSRMRRQRSTTSTSSYDTMAWMEFQRSSLKQSMFREEALKKRNTRETTFNKDESDIDYRKSKESSLMNVWQNLNIIRISKLLMQNEVQIFFPLRKNVFFYIFLLLKT